MLKEWNNQINNYNRLVFYSPAANHNMQITNDLVFTKQFQISVL